VPIVAHGDSSLVAISINAVRSRLIRAWNRNLRGKQGCDGE